MRRRWRVYFGISNYLIDRLVGNYGSKEGKKTHTQQSKCRLVSQCVLVHVQRLKLFRAMWLCMMAFERRSRKKIPVFRVIPVLTQILKSVKCLFSRDRLNNSELNTHIHVPSTQTIGNIEQSNDLSQVLSLALSSMYRLVCFHFDVCAHSAQ